MGPYRSIAAVSLLLVYLCVFSAQAYGISQSPGSYGFGPVPSFSYHAQPVAADQQQGARHLLAYGGGRALSQVAYSVQQYDAETIGLKYSQGNRRRLLDGPTPALDAGPAGDSPQYGAPLGEDIGQAVTVLPTKGAYGGRLPGAYGTSHTTPASTAYGGF